MRNFKSRETQHQQSLKGSPFAPTILPQLTPQLVSPQQMSQQQGQQTLAGSHQLSQQQQHASNANGNQNNLLQFTNINHSTLGPQQHAYSTLHQPTQKHYQQHFQHQHLQSQQLMHFNTLQHPQQQPQTQAQQQQQQHHHQQQNNQQQNNQLPNQYNLNSDYSSSTYHIYDQISDLIIIKQQRLERKRQIEQRRKMICIAAAATILVGCLLWLAGQLMFGSSSMPPTTTGQQQVSPTIDIADSLAAGDSPSAGWPAQNPHLVSPVRLAPPLTGARQVPVLSLECNGHGFLVNNPTATTASSLASPLSSSPSSNVPVCICEPGYQGERCEFQASGATYPSQMQARCMAQSNCNYPNGHCNQFGFCDCQRAFAGPNCEYSSSSVALMPAPFNPLGLPGNGRTSYGNQVIPSATQLPNKVILQSSRPDPSPSSTSPQLRCVQLTNDCSGNGQCTPLGLCKCRTGFAGPNCSQRDLCADKVCKNGGQCTPEIGLCQCKFAYSGPHCEHVDQDQLTRLANCSFHGKFDAQEEKCNCDPGFAGFDCSEERCDLLGNAAPIDCGQNGLYDCSQNKCHCRDGYSGDRCQLQQCSPQCLRNGQCVDGLCVCQPGFYGKHCLLNGCPNQCSGRGQCVRVPSEAPSLPMAAMLQMPQQPQSQQQQSQILQAQQQYSQSAQEWRCQCQPGATGDDCSSLVERQCDDGIDNDGDGLIDCADSECCTDKVCQNSTLCMKSPDPIDILMRKQPPPPTSSFFQRMQFLIEKFSSQIYSNSKDFNDSRASVVRGRVTYMKQGVTGIRVSVAGQTNLGITLTRDSGFFDLMVNGGGAVVIEFRREPFATQQKVVRVPWNEIVLIDPVELTLDSQHQVYQPDYSYSIGSDNKQDAPSCIVHNYHSLRPTITTAPRNSIRKYSQSQNLGSEHSRSQTFISTSGPRQVSRAVILRDSQTVQQSIALPGFSVPGLVAPGGSANESIALTYISSRANEFMSTINIQLTPAAEPGTNSQPFKLPAELKLVHLKIVIEGNLFEQTFEPSSNLSYTWAWNRRNVYRQKSFGLSTAAVSVGYEYFDCRQVIWSTKLVQLAGHDLSISDIGNQWNLNIHHRYNYRDSILQRGDGQNFNLKREKPHVVSVVMGDGYQRQLACPYCDGGANSATEQRLYAPQSLVSGPDGSLYVADHNLIRRIDPVQVSTNGPSAVTGSGVPRQAFVRTLLELPTNKSPSNYSLALNPIDNKLYMSDPDRFQIFLVKQQLNGDNGNNETASASTGADEGLLPIVGSGIQCQLSQDRASACGDGQSARSARLIEPRAIAFDLASRMYIADGPNVRVVESDGKIFTLLGDYGLVRHTKFPCSGEAIPMHKFAPKEPQYLAVSPIDDTLHVLDENVVYKVTRDKRVQIVAGRPAHCLQEEPQQQQQQQNRKSQKVKANQVYLQFAKSIAFGQTGDLFIGEDDQKQIARVLKVSPEDDTLSLFAGLPSENIASRSIPTVDTLQVYSSDDDEQQSGSQSRSDKQRSSNVLQVGANQPTRAAEYKFSSVAAIAIDQQNRLIIADKLQLRILAVEPDLPQMSVAGEYELQSPDNSDELLIFNRFGHHVATREISSANSQSQRPNVNKYTFTYSVNTSFGQLASVSLATGNKISIYRDGPHHSVKMIETSYGSQCKLDIGRNGQVHSISTSGPDSTKTSFSYHVEGGLLKQSRDQASGEIYEFTYDEYGRAVAIQHISPLLPAPVDCRISAHQNQATNLQHIANYQRARLNIDNSKHCAALIVAQ